MFTGIDAYKLLTLGVLVAAVYYLVQTARAGRLLYRGVGNRTVVLDRKRGYLTATLCTLGTFLGFIVVLVLAVGPEHQPNLTLRVVHYSSDAVFALSYASMRLLFTGSRARSVHLVLAWVVGGSFALSLVTGLVLLYQL